MLEQWNQTKGKWHFKWWVFASFTPPTPCSRQECKWPNDVNIFHQWWKCKCSLQPKIKGKTSHQLILLHHALWDGFSCGNDMQDPKPEYPPTMSPWVNSKWPPMTTAAERDDKSQLIYLPLLHIMSTHRLQHTHAHTTHWHIQHSNTNTTPSFHTASSLTIRGQ